jgi:hypothetical protein
VSESSSDQFIWLGCKVRTYSLEIRTIFIDLITSCEQAIIDLNAEGKYLAEILGLEPPQSITDGQWLLRLCNLLGEGPGIPPNWLLTNDIDFLVSKATKYDELSKRWRSLRETLSKKYTEQFFELSAFINENAKSLIKTVSPFFGRDISSDKTVMSYRHDLLNWIYDLIKRGKDWQRDTNTLYSLLGLSSN